MADEKKLKTYRVLFREGHTAFVRAYGYNPAGYLFLGADGKPAPDIYIDSAYVLAVTPVEREEAEGSSGFQNY